VSALGEALADLASVLEARRCRWYVFGAQAVAAHGAPRATQDLDVTAFVPGPELAALRAELRARFEHRYPDLAEELVRDGSVLPLRHVASGFDVDLVLAGTDVEELASSRAERRTLAGVAVPVISATDLVVTKLIAGRPLDLRDARSVLRAGAVDIDEARRVLSAVGRALGDDIYERRLDGLLGP
jgi:hypothetical protein